MTPHLKPTRRQLGWIAFLALATMAWSVLPGSLRIKFEPIAQAATFTVTNTADDGPGSLRQAIIVSNLNMGPSANVINFNIPGAGVKTISPLSPLPTITAPVTIDGFTQPGSGFSGLLIVLDGSNAGANANGLTISSGHCNIYSLVVNRFSGAGLSIQTGDGNLIAGNRIGTDPAGNADLGNGRAGIDIVSNSNTIRANLISGNDGPGVSLVRSRGNSLTGNIIGANANARAALANQSGITIDQESLDNIIGPAVNVSSDMNIIAGNVFDGIGIRGNNNLIRSNLIGNNGIDAIPNGNDGILIFSGAANTIGGSSYFTTNVISGNGANGIEITSTAAVGNQIIGNRIGIDASNSLQPLPNGANGIFIDIAASNNTIGGINTGSSLPANFIAYNNGNGVRVNRGFDNKVVGNYIHDNVGAGVFVGDPDSPGGDGTSILGNRIFHDGGLGIDLAPAGVTPNDPGDGDTGPNGLQNFPVLSSAVASQGRAFIGGTLNSKPNSTYRLEFFTNDTCDPSGNGEAEGFLGFTSVSTGGDGNAGFQFSSGNGTNGALPGQFVVATATDFLGNTSEFSPCRVAQNAGMLSFAAPFATVDETAGSVTLTVNRSSGTSGAVTVDYTTNNATATAGSDFVATSGTLGFADGEVSKTIVVPVLNDNQAEGAETFSVALSNARGGASLGLTPITVVIDDDEIPSSIVYGLTDQNQLVSFNSAHPGVFFVSQQISGERVLGIDFRPATGQLYALGASGHLYTVNLLNNTLVPVGTFLVSTFAGFDFNPVTDRIRVANASGNFEINPDTGAIVATDTPLAFAAGDPNFGRTPSVLGLAHSNNVAGAASTTTYGINWTGAFDVTQLVTVGSVGGSPVSPNSGQLFTVGSTNAATATFAGFDIADTGEAFATLAHPEEGNIASFFKINLATGSAETLGLLIGPNFSEITDIAVQPVEKTQFKSSIFSVNENSGSATITVTRTAVGGNMTVDYTTSDGTATAGADYLPASGSLNFPPGWKSRTFDVTILDDSLLEGVESVNLNLIVTASDSGSRVGSTSTARLAIMDEPTEPGTNPIDNADFFVRQHYSDFLNRQPDAGGLTFWTNHITQCFNDATCVHEMRVGTSAAFFIANEFQQTGFFIYRFYEAALGRRPSFTEFTADRVKVVGGANLENGKQAFATEFVQRQDFVQKYPVIQDGPTFVDALITTASQASGLTDLSTRRDSLIARYNQGANQTDSRVRVVRALIDDSEFSASQYNPAFVLMQYFEYLRRGADQTGYNFWLDHLNNRNPNNYRAMVCAFITSTEYQRRFSQIVTRSNHDCSP